MVDKLDTGGLPRGMNPARSHVGLKRVVPLLRLGPLSSGVRVFVLYVYRLSINSRSNKDAVLLV